MFKHYRATLWEPEDNSAEDAAYESWIEQFDHSDLVGIDEVAEIIVALLNGDEITLKRKKAKLEVLLDNEWDSHCEYQRSQAMEV